MRRQRNRVFFFLAAWELDHGLVNQHLAYPLTTGFVGYLGTGRYYGLDAIIEEVQVLRHAPQVRYVLG